jgi:hypothetical protein
MEKDKKKYRHSTTIYLQRDHNEIWMRCIKARAESLYGTEGKHGKVSKYVNKLIGNDLEKAGFIDKFGTPIMAAIEKVENNLSEKKPIYGDEPTPV